MQEDRYPGQIDPTLPDRMIARQNSLWPLSDSNYKALDGIMQKTLNVRGCDFKVVFNPARAVSSGAKTDAASIAARLCFLCEVNRPDCQEGYPIYPGFTMLVNPFPVIGRHMTIPSECHQPQILGDELVAMYEIALRMPGWTVFYNGGKCGASAPDHLHFQAVPSSDIPAVNLPYMTIRFTVTDPDMLKREIDTVFKKLYSFKENDGEPEPRINLFMTASTTDSHAVEVTIIPRRAHRPDCYGTAEGQMLISPGALDVAGIIITSRLNDFESLTSEKLENILRQTTYLNL